MLSRLVSRIQNHVKQTTACCVWSQLKLPEISAELTVFNDLHQAAQVRQDGTAHQDGNLLHDLDARVSGLPRLLAFAHGFEEGQERGNAEGGGHHGEGSSGRVSDVLVHVVDIGSHRRDHRGQPGSLTHTTEGQVPGKTKQMKIWTLILSRPTK